MDHGNWSFMNVLYLSILINLIVVKSINSGTI